MKNLMQYLAHPCRSIIFTDDRLMNVQVTEALRAKGILAYSTADTPAPLAMRLYMMSPARAVALVATTPRLAYGWADPRAMQIIVVSRKWVKTDAEIALLGRVRERAPNARNAVHFEREADLYDSTENLPPCQFDKLDPELQELIYGYSFDADQLRTQLLMAGTAPHGKTQAMSLGQRINPEDAEALRRTMAAFTASAKNMAAGLQPVMDEFRKSAALAHERFISMTDLKAITKSA